MNLISLNWKPFPVNLDKVRSHLKTACSANFDGLICDESYINVSFLEAISTEDADIVNIYWTNATAMTFAPTLEEIVATRINDAILFGNRLIIEATIGNVAQGITQAGKTKVISDYLMPLQRYLKEGSLYAALVEIDRLLTAGIPPEFDPFVTVERINTFKDRIEEYLGI